MEQTIENNTSISGAKEGVRTNRKVILYLNGKRKTWQVLPPELRGDTSRELGAVYEAAPSRSVCRGLNKHLELALLPGYVGCAADSAEFPAKANEYWNNWSIATKIEGTELDVSCITKRIQSADDPSEFVIVDYPIVPEDYIAYNMIMQNPKVAKTKDELENLDNWDFYIKDMAEQKKQEIKMFELEDRASMEYAKLVADGAFNKKKILEILLLTATPGESFTSSMSDIELKMELLKKSKAAPVKNDKGEFYHPFVKVATDPDVEIKAFMKELLNAGLITKEGNTYFNGDESIGSLKEAISKLKEKTYSGEVLKLQSRLEEIKKS